MIYFKNKQGQKVKTHDNHTKKVQGFGGSAIDHKFKFKDRLLSVADYFRTEKNIKLA